MSTSFTLSSIIFTNRPSHIILICNRHAYLELHICSNGSIFPNMATSSFSSQTAKTSKHMHTLTQNQNKIVNAETKLYNFLKVNFSYWQLQIIDIPDYNIFHWFSNKFPFHLFDQKQVCLCEHDVSGESIALAIGEFITASDQSSALAAGRKKPVSVGIYDKELWLWKDRWERCCDRGDLVWPHEEDRRNGLGACWAYQERRAGKRSVKRMRAWLNPPPCERPELGLSTHSRHVILSFLLPGQREKRERKKTWW